MTITFREDATDIAGALLVDVAALVQATLDELNESLAADHYVSEADIRGDMADVQEAFDRLLLAVDSTDFDEHTSAVDLPIEIVRDVNGFATYRTRETYAR